MIGNSCVGGGAAEELPGSFAKGRINRRTFTLESLSGKRDRRRRLNDHGLSRSLWLRNNTSGKRNFAFGLRSSGCAPVERVSRTFRGDGGRITPRSETADVSESEQ